MEISRVGKGRNVSSGRIKRDTKKDFSQSFSFAREKKDQEYLNGLLEDIKKRGNRLVVTKCYADVRAYKRLIKEYLEGVLQSMYSLKKDISFWQTQYFMTVDTVDEKLEELTAMILEEEHDNIKIASTIDEIQGLMLDMYR